MARTVKLPPLELRADVESVDAEARTVELVWSTGAGVLRGFFRQYVEELSMAPEHVRMGRLQSRQAPLLDSHSTWGSVARNVLGVVESASVDGSEGKATVRFPSEGLSEAADTAFGLVRDKIIRNVSVGYRVFKMEKRGFADDEGEIPILRAVDWEPHEVSLVAVGADAGAGTRNVPQEQFNNCEFVGLDERTENTMGKEDKNQPPTPAPTPAPTPPDVVSIRAEAQKRERERIRTVERISAAMNLSPEFRAKLIEDGVEGDQLTALAMDEYERTRTSPVSDARPGIVAGEDKRDKFMRGAANWLVVRSGASKLVRAHAEKNGEKSDLDPGEFRGMSMIEIARECLELSGKRTRGMGRMDLVGLAFRGSGNTTSDFGVLLENTLHKTLLAAYATTPDTWSRFCGIGTVSDFRPHPRYKMGSFSSMPVVEEHGEFQTQQIPDGEKEVQQAKTRGNIIGITRQAIINDDIDAFQRLPTMFGRAARLSIEVDVYARLAENGGLGPNLVDGFPIFNSANHANEGAGAALSVAALDADRVIMGSQQDPSLNEILELRPHVLLVALGLGGDARVINQAEYDNDGTEFEKPNKVRGLYSDIVDTARLSGTRRYSFADPNVAPVLEVAFLDGVQEPFLEMREAFTVDTMQWKVRLDYGVAGVDFRGAVTDAGV